jgi:hypothetical protein
VSSEKPTDDAPDAAADEPGGEAVTGRTAASAAEDEKESAANDATVRPWLVVAGACAVASGLLWWNGSGDAAFVAAVLGVVAWFWNQRAIYKKIRDEYEDVEDDPADETHDADGRE